MHKTVESVGPLALENIKTSTGEAIAADDSELPVYEKSLLMSVTHCVKDPEDVAGKVEKSAVTGGTGYILRSHID